jgi:uncharacterized protein involved in response to NO
VLIVTLGWFVTATQKMFTQFQTHQQNKNVFLSATFCTALIIILMDPTIILHQQTSQSMILYLYALLLAWIRRLFAMQFREFDRGIHQLCQNLTMPYDTLLIA